MGSSPMAAGQALLALDFYLGPTREFAVVAESQGDDTEEALRLIRSRFEPNKVVAFQSGASDARTQQVVPLLAGKPARAAVTTYICQDFACQEPLAGIDALRN